METFIDVINFILGIIIYPIAYLVIFIGFIVTGVVMVKALLMWWFTPRRHRVDIRIIVGRRRKR